MKFSSVNRSLVIIRKITIILCSVLFVLLFLTALTQAQEQDGWSAPHRLSSGEGTASEGFMVSDQFGYLHVFWIENDLPDKRSIIQYARFDGENWSTPLDIYTTRPGVAAGAGAIGFVSSAVDQHGLLHLIWSEGNNGPVYYSNAPAHDALTAQQWLSPYRIDIPAYRVRLGVDSKNWLHILYSNFYGDEPGVYYIRSEDGGETWTNSTWLDPDIPSNQAPLDLQLGLDTAGGLHAAWNYLNLDGGVDALRYANSKDSGDSWIYPIEIDEPDEASSELRAAKPGLIVQDQIVHIIWAGTEDTNREHRFSTDAGQTWSVPIRIFGGLQGEAIGDGLAIDAASRVHFIGQIRWPQGLYHAYWDQNHWSVPSLAYLIAKGAKDEIGDRVHAHHVRLAVRSGNQLVTTFTDSPGSESPGLYEMHRTLNDVSPLVALPTPTPKPLVTPTLRANPNPIALAVSPTPTRPKFTDTEPALADTPAQTYPLWLGLAPVMVLLGGIIVFQLFRKR